MGQGMHANGDEQIENLLCVRDLVVSSGEVCLGLASWIAYGEISFCCSILEKIDIKSFLCSCIFLL